MKLKLFKLFYPCIIVLLLFLIFARLAKEVIENETYILDLHINSWVSGLRTPFLTQVMKMVSDIGMAGGIFVIGFILANLLYHKKIVISIGLLISSIGASLFTYFLKLIIARDRPELTSRLVVESGFSFPSGHATTAFIAFPILAIIIFFSPKIPKICKFFSILLLTIFPFIVAFSRIYLGVHYFTDVAAGGVIGVTVTYIFYYFKSQYNYD